MPVYKKILLLLTLSLFLLHCQHQNPQKSADNLAIIDIFGADDQTTLTYLDGSPLDYHLDDTNAHYYRYIIDTSELKESSLRIQSDTINSIGAFKEDKSLILHPDYPHIYLQKNIPATYYMGYDHQSHLAHFVAIKASASGLNFFYSSDEDDLEVPYDNSITDKVLTSDFTPTNRDNSQLYEIHVNIDEPILSNFSFALRNDIGSWESLFLSNNNLAGEEARLAQKFAHYELDNQASAIDLGDGAYTYVVDLFGYNEQNLPALYDANGKNAITFKGEKNRANGYYRMTLRSDDPHLSLQLKEGKKRSTAGAFGDGSFTLSPEYPHIYLHASYDQQLSYYMNAGADGKVSLTQLSSKPQESMILSYYDPALQKHYTTPSATNPQEIKDDHPLKHHTKTSYIQSISSQGIISAKNEIAFTDEKNHFFGEKDRATFLMPAYGITIIDHDAPWQYRANKEAYTISDLINNQSIIWQEGANAFGYKALAMPMSWEKLGTMLEAQSYDYHFRHTFFINDATQWQAIAFQLRNYGIVTLYLNGILIDEAHDALQHSPVQSKEGFHERTRFVRLPHGALQDGENSLIVHLKQDPRINQAIYFNMMQLNLF